MQMGFTMECGWGLWAPVLFNYRRLPRFARKHGLVTLQARQAAPMTTAINTTQGQPPG